MPRTRTRKFKSLLNQARHTRSLRWLAWTPPGAIIKCCLYSGVLIASGIVFLDAYLNLNILARLQAPNDSLVSFVAREARAQSRWIAISSCLVTICIFGLWTEMVRSRRRRKEHESHHAPDRRSEAGDPGTGSVAVNS